VPSAEPHDPFVIGDKRARDLDGRGDQEPVGRVSVRQMMELIAATCGTVAERQGFDRGAIEEALDP
jgi:hypothetical protein